MPKLFLKSIFDMRFVVMIPITMCLRIGFSTLINLYIVESRKF